MDETGSKGGRTRRPAAKAPAASKATATKPAATPKATAAKQPAAPRSAAPVVEPQATTKPGGADRAELVRMAAYFRAERRGFAPGYEVEDWLAAEAEVTEKHGPASAAPGTRKATPRKSPGG